MGRCYLPEDWLLEAGVGPNDLRNPANRAGLARVARRMVEEAEPYYDSAVADIGRGVHKLGSAAWDSRVSTSRWRKVRLLLRASVLALLARTVGRWREPPPRQGLWTRSRR
ncbi:squalene/phytoene synthase family protein [Halomonas korlensis]|uniref:Squalene/phytoene synthase n=1 Tax=Halomonas korlensis TaxID=463301 RepID=A0A1I7IYS6_9GAMM|nr:squalene/phytoene synthase family protein [Halomonas korlensis]SFU77971.1 Squalene/phytoene synthase [Halomonas korlensis]